ncbi:MAG: hypothetical protein H0X03_00905 [Nitrosopumilus sp.]|nr:hypothetical protein [Nitrosopumilus sp.]
MNGLLNDVISTIVLSSKPCSKFLENDGIASSFFLLRNYDNKKLISFKDVKTLRKNIPSSGLAITLVKNLDEYHFIICNYVPTLKDNNFFKIKFQKIRILIFLFFNTLSKILLDVTIDQDALNNWIKESNSLLMETSELILNFRESLNNNDLKNLNEDLNQIGKLKKDYFSYFKMDEEKIDRSLYSIYGIEV